MSGRPNLGRLLVFKGDLKANARRATYLSKKEKQLLI